MKRSCIGLCSVSRFTREQEGIQPVTPSRPSEWSRKSARRATFVCEAVDGTPGFVTDLTVPSPVPTRTLLGVALVSGSLLMTELSLTRIFSVTMYYHFAFMAISIALFGLSASGVYVFLMRDRWREVPTERLLSAHSIVYSAVTALAVMVLVKLRVGLTYTPSNIATMSLMYLLSALPFFTGGAAISLAISRLSTNVNAIYA